MLRKIESKNMGNSNLGWLKSKFHFSFAEYYNPDNINFGVLRVINDDLVQPNTGFDTHPHRDMEIISYVVNGELTHGDSMGNKNTITRGHVQYMSAGTGVYHSEHNFGKDTLRLLQIWIFPDEKGYRPNYGDYRFNWDDRKDKWLHIVSSKDGDAQIKINQDMNIYSIELQKGKEISFPVKEGRQAYLVQIEGTSTVNEIELNERDGMEIVEEDILIKAKETSHILILEMKKQD
ncbi:MULTISPECIES: pirin family protein [Clostridium]|uniref:Pirin family protein n=1 Tax=Clostridium faecium TaxID=2762223 RepID=A0ABR8YTA0_9CLOT|nr:MULTISPECIES: pirin family protein [Clostridium]MBD8047482.1 pirin family protein [Clostridium faecium]MDU1349815.1 pirin family protein [Clostridium argentinense]